MNKQKRLGSVPRGLEWIDDNVIAVQDTLPIEAAEAPLAPKAKTSTQAPAEISIDTQEDVDMKSAERGLPKGWTRATLIVRQEHLKKLKALAYWDRVTIKHLLDQALSKLLDGKRVRSMHIKKL